MLNRNRMVAAGAAVAVSICAALPASALAAAGGGDAAATAAFLRSEQQTMANEMTLAPNVATAANAFVSRVGRSCRNGFSSLPASPSNVQNRVATAVMAETVVDFAFAAAAPFDRVERAEATAISGLRWSNARLTTAVAHYAAAERLATQKPGDPCPDIKAAAADQFKVMPPAAQRLLSRASSHGKAPSFAGLLRLMSTGASPAQRTEISQLRTLDVKLQAKLTAALIGPTFKLIFGVIGGARAIGASALDLGSPARIQ